MRRRLLAIGCLSALLFTACATEAPKASKGGTLKIASAGDVDYMDPGQIYYAHSYTLFRVMIRTLVAFPTITATNSGTELVPDLATDLGKVSDDGLTYTFTIREGVKYQPEVAGGRQVTSADVKYAIERASKPQIANGYEGLYFRDVIVGDTEHAEGKAEHISGIDASDPTKVVFHLRRKTGDFVYRMTLPVTAPVPEEYAKTFDAKNPSTYGPNFASTGPYQLERKGAKVTGYVAGKKISMVRNPNWDASTDPIRKAYPDRIEVTEGFTDADLATDKVINGDFDITGQDVGIPPAKMKTIVGDPDLKKRLYFFKGNGAIDYVFMNTTIKPFDNVHVRRAVNYVMDKNGLRLALGGPLKGDLAGNVLMTGATGFDEVGGATYDPYASPGGKGDVTKAKAEMKEAGYANGMYDGPPVLMVGSNDSIGRATDDVMEASLAKIGIKVKRQVYDANIMFTKYYSVPAAKVAIGGGAGWFFDYPDGYTVIRPLYDGRVITPTANNNYSQLNDPKLNDLIDKASAAVGDARGKLWADADRRVMELAPVVPWLWPTSPAVSSARVPKLEFTLGVGYIDLANISVSTSEQ